MAGRRTVRCDRAAPTQTNPVVPNPSTTASRSTVALDWLGTVGLPGRDTVVEQGIEELRIRRLRAQALRDADGDHLLSSGMAAENAIRVQRVLVPRCRAESRTLLGDDQDPVEPVERFLAHLASIERSPHTAKADAPSERRSATTPASRRRVAELVAAAPESLCARPGRARRPGSPAADR